MSRVCSYGVLKPGFLIVELLIAVLIGLVLISTLMRMQSTLCELHEVFYMREKALGVAMNFYEQSVPDKSVPDKDGQKNREVKFGQRAFILNVDNAVKPQAIGKVKVEWISITGRKCFLEL